VVALQYVRHGSISAKMAGFFGIFPVVFSQWLLLMGIATVKVDDDNGAGTDNGDARDAHHSTSTLIIGAFCSSTSDSCDVRFDCEVSLL